MTPEHWQRINDLFHATLDHDPAHRSGFLAEVCGGDEPLRAKVEALLNSHQLEEGFLEGSVFSDATQLLVEDEATTLIGQRIGLYKITGEIGRGGMGAVYLAERDDAQYEKHVAIKLVKRGMDTSLVLSRFRNERQILASFDHPNIARLLDGGSTADGLPYFVMEYVIGEPIDEYCDRHRLAIRERLELFRAVCAAVTYAHQHLVIHRDIKPSNILVTEDGVPKLLDFGIAKILNPETDQAMAPTAVGMRLMTPEYASPEQVRGGPVTTVSDVYSLGVLLYELLSGHAPYRFKSLLPQDIAQIIEEKEPEKPSVIVNRSEEVTTGGRRTITPLSVSATREGRPEKLRRRLTGDLDNIVLMAMRKNPLRRYFSVGQFAEDIRRHLDGLPVIARQDTLSYRSGKFIRRHKVGVTAAAVVVLTLVAGIVATTWEAHVARAERARAVAASARAERRFNDGRRLADSLMFEIHDAIADLPGSTPARALLVKRALEYLDTLAQEAKDDPSLQRELAGAYEKVGDVQGKTLRANLGDTAGAKESYRKALRIRETLVLANPKDSSSRSDLADSYRQFGRVLWSSGDTAGGLENASNEVVLREALAAESPTNMQARYDLAVSHADVGEMLLEQGLTTGAAESLRLALAAFEALLATEPLNQKYRIGTAFVGSKSSEVMLWQGDGAGALKTIRKALAQDASLSDAYPMNAHYREELAIDYERVGDTLQNLGDVNGALESYRKELLIFEKQSAADPANAQFRSDLSSAYMRIGNILATLGHTADALDNYRKALAIREVLAPADSMDLWKRWDLILAYAKTSSTLAKLGQSSAALENSRKTETLLRDTTDDPTSVWLLNYRADAGSDLGDAFTIIASSGTMPLNQRRELRVSAHDWYQRSLDIWQDMRKKETLSRAAMNSFDRVTREMLVSDKAPAN